MANIFQYKDQKIKIGDQVKVQFGVGNTFDGIVMAVRGSKENESFTVRKIGISGIGIEKVFPVASPLLTKIEVKKNNKVRRAKLYYIREKALK
jgi:large subunit ribosomal protein L19